MSIHNIYSMFWTKLNSNSVATRLLKRSKDHGIKFGGTQRRAMRYFTARVFWKRFRV